MKALLLLILFACVVNASTVSCCSVIVGLEDWPEGIVPGMNPDYNDQELLVIGIDPDLGNSFTFSPAPAYDEIPFPQPAYFMDYGVATGDEISVSLLSAQTSLHDTSFVNVGGAGWEAVPLMGTLELSSLTGQHVTFAVWTGSRMLYSSVVHEDHCPEPSTLLLVGTMLIAAGLKRRLQLVA